MKKVLLTISLLAAANAVQADVLGFTVGVNAWQQAVAGKAAAPNYNIDFDYGSEMATNIYVAVEHPVPLIPNFRLENTQLNVDQKELHGLYNQAIVWGNGVRQTLSSYFPEKKVG